MSEESQNELQVQFQLPEIKRRIEEAYKTNFFDVQINCRDVILPAHRYVLSSSSEVLAKQLATGVNKLNWFEFEHETCVALLRWIYTNKFVLGSRTGGATSAQWLDLLGASCKFQLVSLFEICERELLLIMDGKTRHGATKIVEAMKLLEKCSELRLNWPDILPQDLVVEIDRVDDKQETKWFEELLQLNKLTMGYNDFGDFWDTAVIINDAVWQAHAHVLCSRGAKLLSSEASERSQEVKFRRISLHGLYRNELTFLRWLYTDYIEFDDHRDAKYFLEASKYYELPTLFERCEQAIVNKVDVTTCARFHKIGEKQNSTTILKRCTELIFQYFKRTKCPEHSEMNMDTVEFPTEATNENLLMLNDDCLLHLFRFVSVADLASIKDTCKRLRPLADQYFRLCGKKSLKIRSDSMFGDIWVLKHFGKFIKSLEVSSFYERYASHDNIFQLIGQFTGEQLKSISLDNCDRTENEMFECLKMVLKNVECIELRWLNYDSNINVLLGYCENLKEVTIDGESMELQTDWCSKNLNVTKLKISGLDDGGIFEDICNKLTRLECLSVDCVETSTDKLIHLSRLSNLRKLKIEAVSEDVVQALHVIGQKTLLEDLCVSYATMDEALVNAFLNCPNLSKLTFENCYGFFREAQNIFALKLVHIQNLSFKECEDISFAAITKIIENLLDLKILTVTGCEEIDFIDRDNYLILRKKRNLQIFLDSSVYDLSRQLIGNYLSNYVQLKPIE